MSKVEIGSEWTCDLCDKKLIQVYLPEKWTRANLELEFRHTFYICEECRPLGASTIFKRLAMKCGWGKK